jgi:hypothetical protein
MSEFCRNDSANYHAVVTTPYLVGGICYTLGSYAGVLQVLNVHNKDEEFFKQDWCFKGAKHWRSMRKFLSWEPLVGYFAYIIGAILFNVNTGLGFNKLNEF